MQREVSTRSGGRATDRSRSSRRSAGTGRRSAPDRTHRRLRGSATQRDYRLRFRAQGVRGRERRWRSRRRYARPLRPRPRGRSRPRDRLHPRRGVALACLPDNQHRGIFGAERPGRRLRHPRHERRGIGAEPHDERVAPDAARTAASAMVDAAAAITDESGARTRRTTVRPRPRAARRRRRRAARSAAVAPVAARSSASLSTNGRPSTAASAVPTVDLPEPIAPINTT